MATTTSRVWKQIASRVARARWALVLARVKPTMVPRASGAPVRGKEPRESRDKVDPSGVVHAGRQGLDLAGPRYDAQLVPEPLHGRACHRHRPLQGVDRGLPLHLVAHRAEQAVVRDLTISGPVFINKKLPVP